MMLAYNHLTRSVLISLSVLLSGIFFAESQPVAAHNPTDNILSWSVDTTRNGDETSYRNSLLGYEIRYLDTFNEILASIHFSPPPAMPQPATASSEAPSVSVHLDLAGTAAKQFLTLPFNDTLNMSVVQGWTFTGGGAHYGIDYKKGAWKPFDVVAAADGEACGNCVYGPGNKVWIKHTVGKLVYYSYYGHLATIEPEIPLWNLNSTVRVTRGQKIGTAGNTGTRYIHLHFGVYNASWVEIDPYDLYTTSSAYYPNLTYQSMGANHLFTQDPPLYPSQAEIHLPISAYLPLILRR